MVVPGGLTPKPKLQTATIRRDGGRNIKHKTYFFVTSTLRLAAMLDGPYLCPSNTNYLSVRLSRHYRSPTLCTSNKSICERLMGNVQISGIM